MFSIGMQTCICTVSLLVFVAESSALEQIEAQPRPFRALFTEAVVQDIERTSTDDTVMRDRPVVVDVKWLQDLGRKRVGVIGFNFFDDASFCGIVERVETGAAGTLILFGQLSGEHHGSFTVAVAKEVVIGEIRLPDIKEHYQIGYLAKGIHVVREIDDSRFPPCAVEHEHGLPGIAQNAAHDGLRGDLRDGPALIDVMVLYTPRMRLAAGGTEAVDAIIDLIIAESNAAYANSLIDVELRLAQAAEIDYDESGAYIDHLFRLTDPGDGVMDEIHALRDLHRADMVSLLVRDATSCGIAFMMTDLYSGFDNWTFSVVTYTCALAQYTFTHELGHNMGCAHNRANASTQGLRDYSYGYWEPESLFRTVMAYNCPGGCPRVDHFSNPDINYMGRPTGVPPGGPDSAYNAQSINISAPAIACYRISEDCNDNGIPDDQDIAASTSTDCNLNGYPDECEYDCNYTGVPDDCDIGEETSEDCDGNWIPDECDIALGGAGDCNFNSVPDHCDVFFGHSPDVDGDFIPDECCQATLSTLRTDTLGAKNRYLTFEVSGPSPKQAVRVTLADLPPGFEALEGQTAWVGRPRELCENSGQAEIPTGGCGPAPGLPSLTYWISTLGCEPHYADWGQWYEVVHIYHEAIIPSGTYHIQVITEGCATANELNYSEPLVVSTSQWGDVVTNCSVVPCLPPDGNIDIVFDVTALVDKFRNAPGALSKARADIEPTCPDHKINMTDVTWAVDAFGGDGYPYPPVTAPCP